jgi:prepilin-type N-terminal cleavage/methylation domain-containing protein
MKKTTQQFKKGFTLVEVMVATAIFSIIITTGIGSLVNMTNAYRASQQNKIVNDNLNFLIEGISREIRLGQGYYSEPAMDGSSEGSVNNGNSDSIGFTAVENRGYFIYRVVDGVLYRRRITGAGSFNEQLTDISQIRIKDIEFNVVGANEGGVDNKQAFVWIFIRGVVPEVEKSFSVQTLVSQRKLDVS